MEESTVRAFAVVRLHKGREFIDIHTLTDNPKTTKATAEYDDKQSPEWAAYHPVVRIAYVKVTDLGSLPKQYADYARRFNDA